MRSMILQAAALAAISFAAAAPAARASEVAAGPVLPVGPAETVAFAHDLPTEARAQAIPSWRGATLGGEEASTATRAPAPRLALEHAGGRY